VVNEWPHKRGETPWTPCGLRPEYALRRNRHGRKNRTRRVATGGKSWAPVAVEVLLRWVQEAARPGPDWKVPRFDRAPVRMTPSARDRNSAHSRSNHGSHREHFCIQFFWCARGTGFLAVAVTSESDAVSSTRWLRRRDFASQVPDSGGLGRAAGLLVLNISHRAIYGLAVPSSRVLSGVARE
jgi:hypothetical protein